MRWTSTALIFLGLTGSARANHNILVSYPTPTPEKIELLPAGATSFVLSGLGDLLPSKVNINVRMFPIVSSPPRDPYPAVQDPYQAIIYNKAGVSILSRPANQFLAKGQKVEFDFSKETFLVDEQVVPLQEIEVVASDPNVLSELSWDKGKKDANGELVEIATVLRGNFAVIKTVFFKTLPRLKKIVGQNNELWSIVNVLPLNLYLQSVLPSEILPTWHIEALKSQAVAARTYALYEMALARVKDKKNWDVDPTTWYQSYRGVKFRRGQRSIFVEDEATNKAVAGSRHNVLTYNGEVIKAYFSSNSGGVTCSAKECFHLEGENPPYLISVPDAEGVKDKPYGTWGEKANVTPTSIKERLQLMGYPKTIQVKELMVDVTGGSGRVWGFKVKLDDDKEIKLNRIQSTGMMTLFGGIRSYLFKIFSPDQTGRQKVVGHGLGHGVGMSQYGSLLFAEQGWSAERILTYYYTGVRLFSIVKEDEH